MTKLSSVIRFFVRDEEGAAAAEYALILAIIGTAIAAGSILLGNSIGAVMTRASLRMGSILP